MNNFGSAYKKKAIRNIEGRLKQKGLSITDLACAKNVVPTIMREIIDGKRAPSRKLYRKIIDEAQEKLY